MKRTPASAAFVMMANDVFSSHWGPNVIVPRQISVTLRPVRPRRCIFMACSSRSCGFAIQIIESGTAFHRPRTAYADFNADVRGAQLGNLHVYANRRCIREVRGLFSPHQVIDPPPSLPYLGGQYLSHPGRNALMQRFSLLTLALLAAASFTLAGEPGTTTKDKRLNRAKTLNDYFPF